MPTSAVYNTVGRLPYYAACLFYCAAGAFDPLGLKLFFVSTVPASLGGSSGLLGAEHLMPPKPETSPPLVRRETAWWIAATVLGFGYILIIGRGVHFAH